MEVSLRLSGLFSLVAREHNRALEGTPDQVADFIASGTGLSADICQALAMGQMTFLVEEESGYRTEPVILSPEEVSSLANHLGLNGELLNCLLQPTSIEVLRHVCEDLATQLDIDECDDCCLLYDRIEFLASPTDPEELEELACDLLTHINAEPTDDDADRQELAEMLAFLSPEAIARIKEIAFSELADQVCEEDELVDAYCRLRSKLLTELPRRTLDVLAEAGQEIDGRELSERLGMENSRQLSAIPRLIDAAVESARREGLEIVNPLVVSKEGGVLRYRLGSEAADYWLLAIHASESLNQG